jgi:proteasome assembly chaperone (PAC2) family protein
MLELKTHFMPKFANIPYMIAALPDMGNVAGIGINFLIKNLEAKLFAEIYAYWPPFINYTNGLIDYTQTSYKFYCTNSKSNIVIFTGDFNPADPIRLYQIGYEVIKMAEKLGINTIYSMGAALHQHMTGTITNHHSIYAIANNQDILESTKQYDNLVPLEGEGQILGFNGLILGLARNQGINAICLLSKIDDPNIIQPKAAQLILSTLMQILKIRLYDMSELEEEEKRKSFMQQQINYFQKTIQEGKSPGIA